MASHAICGVENKHDNQERNKTMKKYEVIINYTVSGVVTVQADNPDDAKAAAYLAVDQKGEAAFEDVTYRDVQQCGVKE